MPGSLGLLLRTLACVLAAFGQGSRSADRTTQLPDAGVAGAHSGSQPTAISDNPEVVILRLAMAFSDYKTDAVLRTEDCGGETYSGRLHQEAVERFKNLHIAVVDQADITDPIAREAAGLLELDATKLARGVVPEGARDALSHVAVAVNSSQALVLAHSLKVKLGPHGAWQPLYGFNGPQMTTTLTQAALISCRTGRVVWQGQGFRRDLPGISTAKFSDLMKDLYKGLTAIPR